MSYALSPHQQPGMAKAVLSRVEDRLLAGAHLQDELIVFRNLSAAETDVLLWLEREEP